MTPLDKLRDLNPTKKAVSLLEEFKTFALKGNVIDLAIAVVVGGAFTGIVNSLVKNIIMPLVSLVTPAEHGYQTWEITVRGKPITYGAFLADVVNFVILAAAIYFFVVKFLGWVMHARKDQTPAPPTKEEQLLTEIRDLLKQQVKPT
jgi:large conductance mechanosensitive channel